MNGSGRLNVEVADRFEERLRKAKRDHCFTGRSPDVKTPPSLRST